MEGIYLDHNATSPVREEVREAVQPFLGPRFGNPSSLHRWGRPVRVALDQARKEVAELLGAKPREICFTAGGTESDTLALQGAFLARRSKGAHIVISAVEHPAVRENCRYLERVFKARFTEVPVDHEGRLDPRDVAEAMEDDTILVSVMLANNESGVVMPVKDIGALVKARGAAFHCDATQAPGRLPLDVAVLNADLLSISGHKFGGLKGTGALYVRSGFRLDSPLRGGHQERDLRAGTENTAGIVALGVTSRLALEELATTPGQLRAMRDRLERGICERLGREDVRVNGEGAPRLPNTSNISFKNIEGEAIMLALDSQGIAVSTGSACSAGAMEPSPVLSAMKVPREYIRGSVRFSLGPANGESDIDITLEALEQAVTHLRKL